MLTKESVLHLPPDLEKGRQMQLRFLICFAGVALAGCSTELTDGSASNGSKAPSACGTGKIPLAREGAWNVVTPGPSPSPIFGSWACSASDIWAIADPSTVMHFDGEIWSRVDAPTDEIFHSISGSGGDDVWIASQEAVYHFDGKSLTKVDKPHKGLLSSIWSVGPDDVWIGGYSLAHYDGSTWKASAPKFEGVEGLEAEGMWLDVKWSAGPNDVWALGSANHLLHFDGQTWTSKLKFDVTAYQPDDDSDSDGFSMWGSSSNDIWAGGSFGGQTIYQAGHAKLWHWDGLDWTEQNPPGGDDEASIAALSGSGPNDVWLSELRGLGKSRAHLRHYDGTSWNDVLEAEEGPIYSVVSVAPNEAWAFNETQIFHGKNGRWNAINPSDIPTEASLAVVVANAADDIWTFGADVDGGALAIHFDGKIWKRAALPLSKPEDVVTGAWSFAPDDVWAATPEGPLHFDGTSWSKSSSHLPIAAVWGSAAEDLWAVGGTRADQAVISHWDGHTWTSYPNDFPTSFEAIAGTRANDIWAASGTVMVHYDGTRWKQVKAPLDSREPDRVSFAIVGPDDIWLAGNRTMHWDGTRWSTDIPNLPSGVKDQLLDIGVAGSSSVFFSRSDGVVFWDGHVSTEVNTFGDALVFGRGAASDLAVGGNAVFHRQSN
jgi:hypothetical protein